MAKINYGDLNPHIIGVLMREMVRRASIAIHRERLSFSFEITEKTVDYKTKEDFLTSADTAAQNVYLSCIKEWFPNYGVIAEEDNLSVPPKESCKFFFTIDPLDGTKAFIRKQSQAISTMISLVHGHEVISVAIGDIMTGEIYYFRPESNRVHRIHTLFNKVEKLLPVLGTTTTLSETYLLAREDIRIHSEKIQKITDPSNPERAFKSILIESGSIGTMFARLWKGEVGGILLPPGQTTPWDFNPIFGISQKLGYVWGEINGNTFTKVEHSALRDNKTLGEILVVHGTHMNYY